MEKETAALPAQPAKISLPHPLPSLRQLLQESWQRLKGAIKPLIVLAAMGWLPVMIAALLLNWLSGIFATVPAQATGIIVVVLGILQGVLIAIVMGGQVFALATHPAPSALAALRHGARHWLPIVGHMLALMALTIGSLVLVFLPLGLAVMYMISVNTAYNNVSSGILFAAGIASAVLAVAAAYVLFRFSFVIYLAALGEGNGTFRASWQLTHGHVWGILWRVLAVTAVLIAASVVLQLVTIVAVAAHEVIGAIIGVGMGFVVQVFANLFASAVWVVLLRHLQQRVGGSASAAPLR